jgi:hypothetical protein
VIGILVFGISPYHPRNFCYPVVKVKKQFSERGHDWYQKMQNFVLVSKNTNLS